MEKIIAETVLNILSLEDSVRDFEIISEHLIDAGYHLNITRVDMEVEFIISIRSNKLDVILSDFQLPGFDAFGALRLRNEICPDVPFICVSGIIGEETAVELMKQGAADYILKDRLARLPFAIKRALEEAKAKEAQRQTEKDLYKSKEHYRFLFENMLNGVAYCKVLFDQEQAQDFVYLEVNGAFEKLTGLKDVIGKKATEIIPGIREKDPALFEIYGRVALTGKSETLEIYLESLGVWHSVSLYSPQKEFLVSVFDNITERKQTEEKLLLSLENLRKSFGTVIKVMVSAVEMKDPYTAGHQLRTADLARAIATEMGLTEEKIDGIRMAGSIHDIGKLSVPSEILTKPAKLTVIEFSLIKEHAQSGYEMLKDVESPWPLAQIVYQHHERMNGSGYPRNLKKDEIILEARIMAVADVVEAMASHRPYRASLGIEAALEEIKKNKGILFDGDVVDVCLRLFREKGYQLANKFIF